MHWRRFNNFLYHRW